MNRFDSGAPDALSGALAQCIGDHTGKAFEAAESRVGSGGSVNQTRHLTGCDGRSFFVKLNRERDAGRMFEAEARGLRELSRCDALKIPAVIGTGATKEFCFIVLEALDLGGRPDGAALGRGVAQMHGITAARFGLDHDNFIGSTPQPNHPHDDWVSFYRDQRLGFQRTLAVERGARRSLIEFLEALEANIQGFFHAYRPVPALLHGDLWSGNWGFQRDGRAVLFDPAVYYGDPEADLAMMELFGHPGQDFFAAYAEQRPIDAGYPLRRTLYNLYHILNHDHLFGGGYGEQAEHMTRRLLAELG